MIVMLVQGGQDIIRPAEVAITLLY